MLTRKLYGWALVTLVLMASTASAELWYGVDGPVSLKIDSLKVTIKFDDGFSYNQILESIERVIGVVDDEYLIDGFIACSLSTGVDYDAFLDSLDTLDGIYLVEPYYLSENDFV